MIGIGLDITRAGQTVSFSPENLRVGTRDVRDLTLRPNRMYSNLLGTTPIAGPGADVAAMRDSRGVLVATQATAAARLKYAVQPAVGVRNLLLNNRGDGAVVGVLGSGGALPTNWSVTGVPSSAVSVGAVFTKNGRPNLRLRINGESAGNITISFTPRSAAPLAVAGETVTSSVFMQRVFGSSTGFTSIFTRIAGLTASGVAVNNTPGANLLSTITDNLRRVQTHTLVGDAIERAALEIILVTPSATNVDITLDIQVPQFEKAAAAVTDAQITGADGFDVSEPGVRPVHRLVYDGVDDFMDLATAWTSGAGYTLAAAHNLHDSVSFSGTAGTIFGNTNGSKGKFIRGARARINIETDGSNRIVVETATVAGRVVDLVRMISGGEAFYRNGVLSTVFPIRDGYPEPAFNVLGRTGSGYATGSFYGGVMVSDGDTPLTDAEMQMIQRYMEHERGTVA